MNSRTTKQAAGFTLIELMVVVAIIGILSAIAYPSYREHIAKARRAQAQTALLQGAQLLERYYSANGTYLDNGGGLAPVFSVSVGEGASVYYTLASSAGTPAQSSSFLLVATPVKSMKDDKCGNLQVDQAGALSADSTNFADQAAANAYCLRQ